MKYVVENDSGMAIGALTLINDIERSALIRDKYPILFKAAHSIASPQIRNMATIGGNICGASPAGDLPPVLMVLDATVDIAGPKGSRLLAIGEFFRDVKKSVLGEDEFLVEIHIPQSAKSSGA